METRQTQKGKLSQGMFLEWGRGEVGGNKQDMLQEQDVPGRKKCNHHYTFRTTAVYYTVSQLKINIKFIQ